MWTAPGLQEMSSVGSKRLRSYVRSVDAVAHDRCQDGVRDASSKQVGDAAAPLDPAECLAPGDRSITPSVLLEQASASARDDDRRAPNWLCNCGAGGRARSQRAARRGAPIERSAAPLAGPAGSGRVVAFAADHQLPGDQRSVVGEGAGGELGRVSADPGESPGRGYG